MSNNSSYSPRNRQATNNITLSIVNHNQDVGETVERNKQTENLDTIPDSVENNDDESEDSQHKKKNDNNTWKELLEFHTLFPLIILFGSAFCLFFYSIFDLHQTKKFYLICPDTYIWFYVLLSTTIIYLVNYSGCNLFKFLENFTELSYILPVIIIINGIFVGWGYLVINDKCVIENTHLTKLYQISEYHYYLQLFMTIVWILLNLILCILGGRKRKNTLIKNYVD